MEGTGVYSRKNCDSSGRCDDEETCVDGRCYTKDQIYPKYDHKGIKG